MRDLTLNPDFVFHSEMWLIGSYLAVLCVWILFFRFPAKFITALITSALLIIGALRPDSYNSDTLNYASYIGSLSLEQTSDIYFLTKLEPFHIFMIEIARDFRLWLIFETLTFLVLLWILYSRTKTDIYFPVACAFVLTLQTSSMRFALALLILSVLLTHKSRSLLYLVGSSLIASMVHVIMLASGAFASRRRLVPFIFSAAFFALVLFSASVRDRAASDLSDIKSVGLKSAATFIVAATYCFYRIRSYRRQDYIADVLGYMSIFLLTALFVPTLNRFIILGTLILLFDVERYRDDLRPASYLDRIAVTIMVAMIVAPYLVLTPPLYAANIW